MGLQPKRIVVVVVVALLTFGLLYAGQHLYVDRSQNRPLDRILADWAGPGGYDLERSGTLLRVTIDFGPVPDLAAAHHQLLKELRVVAPGLQLSVQPRDDLSVTLEGFLHQVHFQLHESLELGTFTALATAVAEAAAQAGITAKVSVTPETVYLQAEDGGHYLHRTFARAQQGGGPR